MIPKTPVPEVSVPPMEDISSVEYELLIQLLFEENVSRNQQFERFEDPHYKRLHRISKHLKGLHRDLLHPNGEYWIEEIEKQTICLHLHRPDVGLARKVFLSFTEWELLQHPSWEEAL